MFLHGSKVMALGLADVKLALKLHGFCRGLEKCFFYKIRGDFPSREIRIFVVSISPHCGGSLNIPFGADANMHHPGFLNNRARIFKFGHDKQ